MREQWDALHYFTRGYPVHAIGVETYAPQIGQMGRGAWKTAWSFQLACCFAWTLGITPYSQRPDDLKRFLLGKNKGGKVQVMGKVIAQIDGLGEALEEFSPGKWEHLSDAAGHAYLALDTFLRSKRDG